MDFQPVSSGGHQDEDDCTTRVTSSANAIPLQTVSTIQTSPGYTQFLKVLRVKRFL